MAERAKTPWRWAVVLLAVSGATIGLARLGLLHDLVGLIPIASSSASPSASAPPPSASASPSSATSSASSAPTPSASSSVAPTPTPTSAGERFSAGDSKYTESGDDCSTLVDVSEIARGYAPNGPIRPTVEALAKKRYPTGLPFLQVQDDKMLGAWFTHATDSFENLVMRFDAAVHEGSHIWVAKRFNPGKVTYSVRGDLAIDTKRLSNFNRSEILSLHPDAASDSYAKTYLSGSSGAQGFNTLLDEYNAYTHTLASRFCTRDIGMPNARESARDGILAMMFYVETYLRIARDKHPADHAAILADPGHRKLILTVWNRAELWLRRSAPFPALGIKDETYESWAYAPDNLSEITRVRAADAH